MELEFKTLNYQTFLSIGSNLGDRFENLRQAQSYIASEIGHIARASSVYVTQAWGVRDQPDFLNQALEVKTELTPEKMLEKIQRIEKQMGRIKTEKWSKRLIDIDILFYNQDIIQTENLTIPHPFLHERNFVLAPLAEIAPDFLHPIFQISILELYQNSKDNLEAKILTE